MKNTPHGSHSVTSTVSSFHLNLISHKTGKSLENSRPQVLQLVEKELMTSLIRLATEDIDLVGEMRECMCQIPWSLMDKINEFNSSWFKPPPIVVKDDIDGAQQDMDMDEGVETAASQNHWTIGGRLASQPGIGPPANEDENMEEDESLAESQNHQRIGRSLTSQRIRPLGLKMRTWKEGMVQLGLRSHRIIGPRIEKTTSTWRKRSGQLGL